MDGKKNLGFVVLYRWRVRAGMEDQFLAAWEIMTRKIKAERGGLGSRSHHADDGTYVAYARWPDRATWEAMGQQPSVDPEAGALMLDAIEETLEPILMEPLADLLD